MTPLPIRYIRPTNIIGRVAVDDEYAWLDKLLWYMSDNRRPASPRTQLKWLTSTHGPAEIKWILLSRLIVMLSYEEPTNREDLVLKRPWEVAERIRPIPQVYFHNNNPWDCRLDNLKWIHSARAISAREQRMHQLNPMPPAELFAPDPFNSTAPVGPQLPSLDDNIMVSSNDRPPTPADLGLEPPTEPRPAPGPDQPTPLEPKSGPELGWFLAAIQNRMPIDEYNRRVLEYRSQPRPIDFSGPNIIDNDEEPLPPDQRVRRPNPSAWFEDTAEGQARAQARDRAEPQPPTDEVEAGPSSNPDSNPDSIDLSSLTIDDQPPPTLADLGLNSDEPEAG